MARSGARSRGLFNTRERRAERMRATDGTALGEGAYNLTIGATLTAGLALTAVLTNTLPSVFASLKVHPAVVLVVCLVLAIASCIAINKSRTPILSGVGFLALSVAMGALLAYALSVYSIRDIQTAVLVTGAITATMMLLATVFPAFFRKLGVVLAIALIADIAVGLIAAFVFHTYLGVLSWVGVVIFSLYIGYDWARAQEYPKTVNNAIVSAADVYVDIINLFLFILDVMGDSK
ncbi:MAG: US12 family protein [Olsenella sp.]|nr:US12 family protein [Olsenella sp.]